jgi:hypothetical protein
MATFCQERGGDMKEPGHFGLIHAGCSAQVTIIVLGAKFYVLMSAIALHLWADRYELLSLARYGILFRYFNTINSIL